MDHHGSSWIICRVSVFSVQARQLVAVPGQAVATPPGRKGNGDNLQITCISLANVGSLYFTAGYVYVVFLSDYVQYIETVFQCILHVM